MEVFNNVKPNYKTFQTEFIFDCCFKVNIHRSEYMLTLFVTKLWFCNLQLSRNFYSNLGFLSIFGCKVRPISKAR